MKIKHYCIVITSWLLGMACQPQAVETISPAQAVVSSFFSYTLATGVKSMSQLVIDRDDNLYFSDYYGHRVWKVTSQGKLSVFAGSGKAGLQDGLGEQAQFDSPMGLAFDSQGNLYVSQALAIRQVTPQGLVSTRFAAGIGGVPVHYTKGDTTKYPYLQNSLLFVSSTALALDLQGNLFVTEADNAARVLKITPTQTISVFYGEPFYDQLQQANVPNPVLSLPTGLVFDLQGNLIITDGALYSSLVRVSPTGVGSYFSNQGYRPDPIVGLTLSPFLASNGVGKASANGAVFDRTGNLYVCNDQYIHKVAPGGQVSTIAGSGKSSLNYESGDNGLGDQVRLFNARSPVIDSKGDLFFLEQNGIRKLVLPH